MSLYDLEIADWQTLLLNQPSFRPQQIWKAIHQRGIRPEQLTSLPKQLRDLLKGNPDLSPALELVHLSRSQDQLTDKALFKLSDGQVIETVLMHYPDRSTVCVSSQAGCAMNCGFCATGQRGFFRHLKVGEIIEQVIWATNRTKLSRSDRRLSNIVFMGMGEPLANTKNLFPSLRRINSEIGIGARHITVSTVGIIPGINKFTHLDLQVNLAISLHAANNQKRSALIPINNRYPVEDLMDTLLRYKKATNRRVSFEWAMIDGVNDSDQDASELIGLSIQVGAHVNLIPLNPTPGWPTKGSPIQRVREFAALIERAGVPVSIRDNRGTEIDAACGQLAGTIDLMSHGEQIYLENSAKIELGALLN
jgi:23S rRNA (adenine2503-C2)-methyltransferase